MKALYFSLIISSVIVFSSWVLVTYFQDNEFLSSLGLIILVPGLLIGSLFKNTWALLHEEKWFIFIYICAFIFYSTVLFAGIKSVLYAKLTFFPKTGRV